MSRFKLMGLLMASALLTFLACGPREQSNTAEEPIPVQVIIPQRMDVEDVLHFIGELRPDKEVKLDFNISGRIAELNFEVGDRVAQGEVMAILSQEEILAHLEQAEAAYHKAVADLERIERLHEERIASDDRLEAARVGSKQAHAAYVMAQEALNNSTIRAPFSGSVADKNGEVGEYFNSMMGGPPVYRIMKIDLMKVVIGVPESEVPRVKMGQEARITLDTYPGRIFRGQVSRVGLTIERDSRTMEVEITAPNERNLLKSGMLADIELVVDRRQAVLSVPLRAVLRDMGLEHVFIVVDEKAAKSEVISGVEQNGRVEIVEGLTGIERVVVGGQFGLKEGDLVDVTALVSEGQEE